MKSAAKPAVFTADALEASLAKLIAIPTAAKYCIGFSGGLDSTALLLAMAELRARYPAIGLRAVHVNHHLLPRAGDWAAHCEAIAHSLVIPFKTLDANVQTGPGVSIEAAARDARYMLLALDLQPEELLLTAHHEDDQLETVLLQLLRGAGVPGLAAMPASIAFGRGRQLRPLLNCKRAALEKYVCAKGVAWIEDDSNANRHFDRNYLRHAVIPLLTQRWPSAAANAARSAAHLAEAQALLDDLARQDLIGAQEGDVLRIASLRALDQERARNLLRYWIRSRGLPLPSTVKLQEILRQMLAAEASAMPCVRWEGIEARRHRDRLFIAAALPPAPGKPLQWEWRTHSELQLPLGRLRLRPAQPGERAMAGLPATLMLRWRADAAAVQGATGLHNRLRALFQDRGIVPWVRDYVPLVFAGDALLAVGDLWFDSSTLSSTADGRFVLEWLVTGHIVRT